MLQDLIDSANRNLRSVLLWICGLLLVGAWLAQVNPYLNAANDSGRYMILGQSISHTGDLRLINEVKRPLDTLYPPAYPALIAGWLIATGHDLITSALLVKATQILLMVAALPMLFDLLSRARLRWPYVAGAMLTFALSPAIAGYANEVMSESVFLFLVLVSIFLIQPGGRRSFAKAADSGRAGPDRPDRSRHPSAAGAEQDRPDETPADASEPHDDDPGDLKLALSLAAAALAFLVRTSGIALLLTLTVWYWRRFGRRWGSIALVTLLIFAGGWQLRNRRIVKSRPDIHYSTYLDQFSLREPDDPRAGRIALTPRGLLGRAYRGFPRYIGMIPRSVMYAMAPSGSIRLVIFYIAAIPFTLLAIFGLWVAWRRDLKLMVGFSIFFWLLAAMWPWVDARFLVPLIPFTLIFLFLGMEEVLESIRRRTGDSLPRLLTAVFAAALLAHFVEVDAIHIRDEHRPTMPGYAFGRSPAEGGFYSACDWLMRHAPPGDLVMGRPAYLLSIYSDHPTVQIEPTDNPKSEEKNYVVRQGVRYLVYDAWSWSKTPRYLRPYLAAYGDKWLLAWKDPAGSGVQVWQRR